MFLSQKRRGVWDSHLGTSGNGSWCFVNYDIGVPWFHVTLAEVEGNPPQTVLTNDIVLVKQILDEYSGSPRIKSFQAVFPSKYPDNKGWGIAEIYMLSQSTTSQGEVYHSVFTRFGPHRIGGSDRIMAMDVRPRDTVVLYETERPIEPKFYYGK